MTTFLLVLASSLLAGGGMYLSLRDQLKTCETAKAELINLLVETRDILDESQARLAILDKPQPRCLSLQGEPMPLKLVIKQSVA